MDDPKSLLILKANALDQQRQHDYEFADAYGKVIYRLDGHAKDPMRDEHGRFIRDEQDRRMCYINKQKGNEGNIVYHLCDSLGSRRRVTISLSNHCWDADPVCNVWVHSEHAMVPWNAPSGPKRSQYEVRCTLSFQFKSDIRYKDTRTMS